MQTLGQIQLQEINTDVEIEGNLGQQAAAPSDFQPLTPPSFGLLAVRMRGAWAGFAASTAGHAAMVAILFLFPFTVTKQIGAEVARGDAMEIRIGGKVYYVTSAEALRTLPHVQAPATGGAGVDRPAYVPPKLLAPAMPRLAELSTPGIEANSAIDLPAPPQRMWREFSAPAPKRVQSDEVLVRLDVPPDVAPSANARIPNAVVWSAALPRMPAKPLVIPGVKKRDSPTPTQIAPDQPMVMTEANPLARNPKLPVQASRPVPGPPLPGPPDLDSVSGAAPSTGAPVHVLAIGRAPVQPSDTLHIPYGNAGPSGNSRVESGLGVAPTVPGWPAPGGGPSTGAAKKGGPAVAASYPGGQQNGRGSNPSESANEQRRGDAKASPGQQAAATPSSGRQLGTGSDRGAGPQPGAEAGSGSGGNGIAVAGVVTPPPAAAGSRRDLPYPRLTQPVNGDFDAVVVQSASIDILEDYRSLLTGKPVYTVYLALGTARDWIMQYCVPSDGQDDSASNYVVKAGAPAPLRAPYPVLMYRPPIALKPGDRYMLVHGFIGADGRFEHLQIVHHGTPQTDASIPLALLGWEFRPASRDGQPVGGSLTGHPSRERLTSLLSVTFVNLPVNASTAQVSQNGMK